MWGSILAAGMVLTLIPLAVWLYRTDFLLHVAGVDPGAIRTVPDRARYSSMGAVILLTASAAMVKRTRKCTVFETPDQRRGRLASSANNGP